MAADTTTTVPREPTPPELRVLRLVAEGKTNGEIAADLFVVEDTVKGHVRRLFVAWSVGSRMELVRFAVRRGWLACPNCDLTSESERLLTTAANTLRQLASNLDVSATYATPRGGGDRG